VGVIEETRQRLLARLEELRPAIEEARRIQAALAALAENGPADPVTALDTLKPVLDETPDHPPRND
jgi:hypothetical protein